MLGSSRKAALCAQHAADDTANVQSNKCGQEGCLTRPSYGEVGSRKAGFGSQNSFVTWSKSNKRNAAKRAACLNCHTMWWVEAEGMLT